MATKKMDALAVLGKQLQTDDGDLMRQMVQEFAENLMGSEVDALCGAGFGERSDERVNQRNGYRERDWDTRAGVRRCAFTSASAPSKAAQKTPG